MNPSLLAAIFTTLLANGSGNAMVYDTLPDDDDIALTAAAAANTYGSYAAIVTSVGASPIWVTGIYLAAPSVATDFKVEAAHGASGSETPFASVPILRTDTTAAGVHLGMYYGLPFPRRVEASTRLAARAKSGATTADTITLVLETIAGLPI